MNDLDMGISQLNEIKPPIPISTFVFKLTNECNLNCSYCYEKTKHNSDNINGSLIMSDELIVQTFFRISEHITLNKISQITIVLHGGEPLLVGINKIAYIFHKAHDIIGNQCKVEFIMQTNGLLLDEKIFELFYKNNARIGISLDGDNDHNNKRLTLNGKSSFELVEQKIKLLKNNKYGRRIFTGFLSVIDTESNPIIIYNYLANYKPLSIDFLLPMANHELYPPSKLEFEHTPYANWLIHLFDYWFILQKKQIRIKLFSNLIILLLGGNSETELIGNPIVDIVTINPNGAIDGIDTLDFISEGASSLKTNVFQSKFEEILSHPVILSRMQGLQILSPNCLSCKWVAICGGGYLPHRYSKINNFSNPSVYCKDLAKLIQHIRSRLVKELAIHD
jgi:uncharacterized protein